MDVREMRLKDLKKVRELEISCIREYFADAIENRWEDLPQEWKDNLGASSPKHFKPYLDDGLSFVAEEDGEVYGFIFARMLHHIADCDSLLWIENMGVDPVVRRNKVGTLLLRACVKAGRERGAEVAHGMIEQDNAPSIMLFKDAGFFMDRREVALMDLKDPKLRLRGFPPDSGETSDRRSGTSDFQR